MKVKAILSLAIMLLLGSQAAAQVLIPDPAASTATSAGGQLYICPAGDGQSLASAGATVTITLIDNIGQPVYAFPPEDLWLESDTPGELAFCFHGNIADGQTDVNGQTTFSGVLIGGGHTSSLRAFVDGVPITGSPAMAIDINSPDLNGDLNVNLCDVLQFDQDLFGAYHFRSDFDHNGTIDLNDVATLSQHLCQTCPEGSGTPTYEVSGEIGVFFDPEGTQTGIMDIEPLVPFNFYVVAFDATGGISGYQFGVVVDPNIALTNMTPYPAGAREFGNLPGDIRVGTGGDCLPETGAVVLVEFEATLTEALTNGSICLGPSPSACANEPQVPAYLSCEGPCDWRVFNPAYEGCAVVNGMGPISTTQQTWGAVKALYNR